MATKKVKLSELKVSELKKELEERDLDTSGVKIVLQQRLTAGFARSLAKILKNLIRS